MRTIKFAGHPAAQVKIEVYDCGSQALISYNTAVVRIDEDGWLEVCGLYSMTTRRHISWYMSYLGFNYALARTLYHDGMKMNIRTGEVIKVET